MFDENLASLKQRIFSTLLKCGGLQKPATIYAIKNIKKSSTIARVFFVPLQAAWILARRGGEMMLCKKLNLIN